MQIKDTIMKIECAEWKLQAILHKSSLCITVLNKFTLV